MSNIIDHTGNILLASNIDASSPMKRVSIKDLEHQYFKYQQFLGGRESTDALMKKFVEEQIPKEIASVFKDYLNYRHSTNTKELTTQSFSQYAKINFADTYVFASSIQVGGYDNQRLTYKIETQEGPTTYIEDYFVASTNPHDSIVQAPGTDVWDRLSEESYNSAFINNGSSERTSNSNTMVPRDVYFGSDLSLSNHSRDKLVRRLLERFPEATDSTYYINKSPLNANYQYTNLMFIVGNVHYQVDSFDSNAYFQKIQTENKTTINLISTFLRTEFAGVNLSLYKPEIIVRPEGVTSHDDAVIANFDALEGEQKIRELESKKQTTGLVPEEQLRLRELSFWNSMASSQLRGEGVIDRIAPAEIERHKLPAFEKIAQKLVQDGMLDEELFKWLFDDTNQLDENNSFKRQAGNIIDNHLLTSKSHDPEYEQLYSDYQRQREESLINLVAKREVGSVGVDIVEYGVGHNESFQQKIQEWNGANPDNAIAYIVTQSLSGEQFEQDYKTLQELLRKRQELESQ